MTATVTLKTKVHQSKWGYHPISREASRKLRFINGVYAKSQHMAGAWERWDRKHEQNRVIKRAIKDADGKKIGVEIVMGEDGKPKPWVEPEVCPLFHEKVPGHVKWGSYVLGVAKDNGYGQTILAASRQARKPQPTAEEVAPFPFTEEEIDKLYETAKAWKDAR